MASAAGAVALDERCGAEILKTRSRAGERLTASLGSGTRVLRASRCFKEIDCYSIAKLVYHDETVADPQAAPAGRALWDVDRLTVHC